jgi:hypothetical protein
MIDVVTKMPIRVLTAYQAAPYIKVSQDQAEKVTKLLAEHRVRHWVDHQFISFNGGPFMGVINLYEGVDPAVVQEILDRVD